MKAVLFSVVQLLVFAALVSAQGCRSGICVEGKYCLDSIVPGKTRTCRMRSKTKGVCCGAKNITLATNCGLTYKNITHDGKCVDESICYPTRLDIWRLPNRECSIDRSQDLYCCPENFLVDLDLPQLIAVKRNKTVTVDDVNRAEFAIAHMLSQNVFPTCRTPDYIPGHYAPLRLCDPLYNQFRKGLHKGDLKFVNWPSEGTDSTSICCPYSWSSSSLILHKKAEKLGLDKCGPVPMDSKVLVGEKAGLGQYPWMANVMYKVNKTHSEPLCSGSLIHARYVLTAAHCKQRSGNLIPVAVRLGEYDLSKVKDCEEGECAEPYQEHLIEKWISHFGYRYGIQQNDIALIRLKTKVAFVPGHTFPICLPLATSLLMLKPKQLTVTGWGGMTSDVMLKGNLVNVVDGRSDLCTAASTFCARGVDGPDHCRGDSGSPLQAIVPVEQTYRTVLFGIAVEGPKECTAKDVAPTVSVLVGYHIHWILDNVEDR